MAAVVVLSACGNNNSGGSGSSGNLAKNQTLSFPIFDDVSTLDPGIADAETEQELQQNVWEGLVGFDKNLNVVPQLATALPDVSSDGLTYTFHLRHGVVFSNGDPFTAKDVLYSWNRGAALQGSYATNMSPIVGYDTVSANTKSGADLETALAAHDPSVTMSGLTAPDDYTVVAKLSAPAGWWLSAIALTGSTGMVVDENAVKQNPDNWWSDPATAIGTGPFKVSGHVAKQSWDFVRNDKWWGSPKPTLTSVHLDILQDPSSGVTAWEQGKYAIDGYGGYSGLPVTDILRIKNSASESKNLLFHPKVRSTWISFNVGHASTGGPFLLSDGDMSKNLRMAFDLAIDHEGLIHNVCQDVACLPMTGGLITKGLKGYLGDNEDPLWKFDPTTAKSLLKQADPTGSKTRGLTFYYDPDAQGGIYKPTCEYVQAQWQQNLGVSVACQPVPHHQFIKARLSGKYVITRDGWQADYDHPQDWFDNLFGYIQTKTNTNTTGYDTPQYDSLLKQADAEPLSQALPLYEQMGKMLQSDVVYIPLYYTQGTYLIHSWVQGAGTNNFFDNPWKQISILSH